jgi:uncharacterized protein (TIGR02391 family)
MPPVPSFPASQIEALAKVLGECGAGSDISRIFWSCGLADESGESTKWRRINRVFLDSQAKTRCGNKVLEFIKELLAPARFVGKAQDFEAHRQELNTVLAFSGLEYSKDGVLRSCGKAETLDQADERARTIRARLQGRAIHPEVLKYCRAELLQDNYFHAVFEAAKGLAQRVRELSGVHKDGAALVDLVFSMEQPLLAFNTLRTETERSEHKGFASLLKGCFAAVRNPLAHEPKVLWQGEDDAADYMSLISLLHRKLDECVRTSQAGSP